MNIDAFNAEFGIDGTLRIVAGRGGLAMIEVYNRLANATISPYAGQVLSYCPVAAADDLLFVSERAFFAPGKGIKGGVPICWPWFGAGGQGGPAHGFARQLPWSILATASLPSGATRVTLGLADDADTQGLWPYHFNLLVEITVGATLTVELISRNAGDQAFQITQGLHTYFRVGDATRVRVLGLDGCTYIDKAAGANDAIVTQRGPVTVAAEVNRIYESVPAVLTIEDPVMERRIRITNRHSATCVVWNPWVETARAMADLDDRDYRIMLCVETVNTASEVIGVPGGGEARLAAEYAIEPL
ncbi:D-hexose-6-phosphate mutarotase [uncultured Thiodictyon sp.]|uniref:D-hexose-6-phosphate mutarotase n=1 Tax=uncultured Thiodictyon sp. TaxID=1846217 RepID=UPI0025FDFB55|nr:D-hexose-6-phosphate mutarotase [uncultured Thiodictyon sp.]